VIWDAVENGNGGAVTVSFEHQMQQKNLPSDGIGGRLFGLFNGSLISSTRLLDPLKGCSAAPR
jgi:hypothetical protein